MPTKHLLPRLSVVTPVLLMVACTLPGTRDRQPSGVAPGRDPEVNGPADNDWNRWLAPPAAEAPQPQLTCKEPNRNAGPLWEGSSTTYRWLIRNEGRAPLRVLLWE